jgi:multidrug efflux pump subunit AcrB
MALFLGFCVASCGLFLVLGEDFFPAVDAGQIRLHMRAATGTRIEETARLSDQVEQSIRELIPEQDLDAVLANIGVTISSMNMSYNNAGTFGVIDSEILISLKHGHAPTRTHIDRLRAELPRLYPGTEFYFQPPDIISQILNFGSQAPIDIQFSGKDMNASYAMAKQLLTKVEKIPGVVDAHIHQRLDQPTISLNTDRTALQALNLSAANVAQNLLVSLSGSFQTQPAFWVNPANSVAYNVLVQTPQYQVNSLDKLLRTPVNAPGGQSQLLGNLVNVTPEVQPAVRVAIGVLGRVIHNVRNRPRPVMRHRSGQVVQKLPERPVLDVVPLQPGLACRPDGDVRLLGRCACVTPRDGVSRLRAPVCLANVGSELRRQPV